MLKTSREVFFYYHGLGDSILFNSVVYELGRQTGKSYLIGTRHREIYRGNPHATLLPFSQNLNYKIFGLPARLLGLRIHNIDYYFEGRPPKRHILQLLCERVGLKPAIERPTIYLSPEERARKDLPPIGKPWVAIQSTGLSTWTENKNWGVENFRAVVQALQSQVAFVQLGASSDPSLGVDLELQGKIKPRDACVLLRQCRAFVGQVGFLMHAAAAVNVPSVIVYGGFEAPWQSGYPMNLNLYSDVECAPCWLESNCPHEKKCMAMIKPEIVVEKTKSLLGHLD